MAGLVFFSLFSCGLSKAPALGTDLAFFSSQLEERATTNSFLYLGPFSPCPEEGERKIKSCGCFPLDSLHGQKQLGDAVGQLSQGWIYPFDIP